jgi:endonuclease YncB( thermonuclease family)
MPRPSPVSIAVMLLFTSTAVALSADLVGQASIIDGDTLEIHGTRIRLWGIDAPESHQLCRSNDSERYRCGQRAANDLDAFISRRAVECIEVDRDRYGRAVAVCTVAGVDIAEWLVKNGLALDWPKYSKGDYAAVQNDAKRAERGIWSGRYVEPWRYRACRRSGGFPNASRSVRARHPHCVPLARGSQGRRRAWAADCQRNGSSHGTVRRWLLDSW